MPEVLDPPARKGRAYGWRKHPVKPRANTGDSCWSIERWICACDMSRSALYSLWKAGRGPQRVRIGGRTYVLETPREFCGRIALEQSNAENAP